MIGHLSYSSISLYLSCPEAWRRKYVTKEPTYSTPELSFGSAFHNTVERFILHGGDLLNIWREKWAEQAAKPDIFWGADTPAEHENYGVRLFGQPDIVTQLETIAAAHDLNPEKIEQKVSLEVLGVPVPVIGYIDYIGRDNVPADFKTSSRAWTQDRAAGELQSLFYLAALNQAGKPTPGWKFKHIVLVKNKTPRLDTFEHAHKPGEVMWLMSMIRSVWEGIEREVFYPNPTGWKCSSKYCDFWSNCRGKWI